MNVDGVDMIFDGSTLNHDVINLNESNSGIELDGDLIGHTSGSMVNATDGTVLLGGQRVEIFDTNLKSDFTNKGAIEVTGSALIGGGVDLINKGSVSISSGGSLQIIEAAMTGHGAVAVEAGGSFVLDGAAGTENNFIDIASGTGSVSLTGGTGNDTFLFGGNFAATDTVDGGAGGIDRLVLHGNYAGAHALTFADATVQDMTAIQLNAGFNYDVTTSDANVAAGATLRIGASALGANNRLVFDGSAETDGHFIIQSGLGADVLTGGALSDTFVYRSAAASTSTGYDTIHGLDFGSDVLNVHGIVRTIDARVFSSLSTATFDSDLANAVDGHLTAHGAMLVRADAGSLDGKTFLVIDQNGIAGYQSGADLVIHLAGHTGTLTTAAFV